MSELKLIIKHLNKINEVLPRLGDLLLSKTDRESLQDIQLRLERKLEKLEEPTT